MSTSIQGVAGKTRSVFTGSIGGTAVDQILSTVSNLIISIGVSRLAGARELGSFTLIFTTATLLTGFQRSLIAEPLLTLPLLVPKQANGKARRTTSRKPPPRKPPGRGTASRKTAAHNAAVRKAADRTAAARAAHSADPESAAVSSAAVFAFAVAVIALVVGLATGQGLVVALAAMIPGLLLQDLFRYAAFRRQRPWQAAGLDLVWVLGVSAGLPVLAEHHTATVGILIWGLGAWLAAVVHLARRRVRPSSLTEARVWWVRDARRMGGLLALDGVVYTAANQGATYGLAVIVGLGGLGELRSAQIVLGPTGIALTALQLYALPRLAGQAPSTWRDVGRLSGAAVAMATVLVTAAVIAGHLIGVHILGQPLLDGLNLLPPLAVATVLASATVGPLLALKALRDVGAYSVTHLASAAIGVPGVLLVANYQGLRASVWASVGEAGLDLAGVALALHLVHRRLARTEVRPNQVAHEPEIPAADERLLSGG